MIVREKDLGLMAYIYLKTKHEGTDITVDDEGRLVMDVPGSKPISKWKMEYLNSECRDHDQIIMKFRDLLREARNNR